MSSNRSLLRACVFLTATMLVASCGLPRSGPYYSEITEGEAPADYGFEIVPMTPAVTRATTIDERSGFSVTFLKTAAEPYYLVERGDVLSITVWENSDEGLLNPAGVGATQLPQSKVDEHGKVFVPYVGLMQAAGRSLTQLRRAISGQLGGKTVDPQVDVFPIEQTGRSVSIQGRRWCAGRLPD